MAQINVKRPTSIVFALPVMLTLAISACVDDTNTDTTIKKLKSAIPDKPSLTTQDQHFIQKLATLNRKNPVSDAQTAIQKGKPHFLCNIGRSSTVPGLTPETYAEAREHCPTHCLDGVSDAIYGRNHAQYLSAAVAYSASWNQVVIDACRS